MNDSAEPHAYVLGHSLAELTRLERQGQIFAAETRETLHRAGISPGMNILDIGCGVGDVSMIAAEIVGKNGRVVGIDTAERALPAARARAARAGYNWLSFTQGNVYDYAPHERFDAAVGRFILAHLADPVAAVQATMELVAARGIVTFIELDIGEAGGVPEMPLLRKAIDWMMDTYRKVGVQPDMGRQLYATFRAAGLAPHLAGTCRIESGPDSIAYEFAAETLRSLLPAAEAHGIVSAAEADIDTLADRLRAESVAGDHCIFLPRVVGAWATTPA